MPTSSGSLSSLGEPPSNAAASAAAATTADLPPHSDNVDEELHRIRLALEAVFSPAPPPPAGAAAQQSHHHAHNTPTTSDHAHAHAHAQHAQWWSQRQLADRYLTSFQSRAAVAWMVCDRLLQEPDDSHNSSIQQQRRFFAAQTLHTKCCADMHELPAGQWPSLRDSLLQHLQRYAATSSSNTNSSNDALTTRLSMCISALAVHLGWTTILSDLLLSSNANTDTNTRMALWILRALPEECASDRLYLLPERENNRFLMRDHLISSAPRVFAWLLDYMNSSSSNTVGDGDNIHERTKAVFQTFFIWIRYVPIHPSALVDSPLLTAAFHAMTPTATDQQQQQQQDSDSMTLLELAADVLVEVLRMYPSHSPGNEGLVQRLLRAAAQQELPLQQALRACRDPDVWRAHCRVFTEMGESYLSLILGYEQQQQQPNWHQQAAQLVEWVLQCTEIADTEIAGMTLHFWYRLVADLEDLQPLEWRQELVDGYTAPLLRLVQVCVCHLMRFPVDDDLLEDEVDDLLRDRSYVAETLQDCCRLLGGQCVLQTVGGILKQEMQKVQDVAVLRTEWQGIESCLACVAALHSFVPSDEAEILPLCFRMIPQLPGDQARLRHTASQAIGKFAAWLAAAQSAQPDLLQPLLPFLAQGLHVPDCAAAAAVAIKELCACSNNQNFAIAEPVLQLYEELMMLGPNPPQPQQQRQQPRLELSNELHILEGVCLALSRTIQDTRDDGTQALTRLAQPIGNRLAVTVNDASASPRAIIPEVDRLTVIVRFLTVPHVAGHHPMIELLQSSWRLLDASTNRFPNDVMLAEKICRLHKHTLRVCGAKAYAPMLDDLMKQLVHSFQRTYQSPFLYAASICITEYGADPAYTQRLYDMVAAMATIVFSFLRTLEELTNQPDVVEEFFYLMARMMTYCPDPVVVSPLLQSLMQCAAVGMQLQHSGANKGTLKFLDNTITYGLRLRELHKPEGQQAALEQVLSQEGQAIVVNLARAMMGDLPSYNNQVPEILWKMNLLCPGLLAQWLASAFACTPSVLPERAKADFLSALDTGLARDEFSLVVRAFQSACDRERRFRKMTRRA